MDSSFSSAPAWGRRTADFGAGAARHMREALVWEAPPDGAPREMTRAVGTGTDGPLQWQSEAAEAYSYFQPLPPPVESAAVEEPAPAPPPVAPPAAAPARPKRRGAPADSGVQTTETTLKPVRKAVAPPKSAAPRAGGVPGAGRKPPPPSGMARKPPFHAYGRGNTRPLNSSDFLASYNLLPLLHRTTDRDLASAVENDVHKVYESALARVQFNADAFSSKGLQASAARALAESRGESRHTPAVTLVDPSDTEVVVWALADGRRDVSTQRTALLVEDSVRLAGGPALDLAALELKSGRYRSLQGFSWGCGAATVRADAQGRPLPAFDAAKAATRRVAVKPPLAFGASMVHTQRRPVPESPPSTDVPRRTKPAAGPTGPASLWSVPPSSGVRRVSVEKEDEGALTASALAPDVRAPPAPAPPPAPPGRGILSRLVTPSDAAAKALDGPSLGGDSGRMRYLLSYDEGRAPLAGHSEAEVIAPRASSRLRPRSADASPSPTRERGSPPERRAHSESAGGEGGLARAQHTQRASERYEGGGEEGTRLHANARTAAHFAGGGRVVPSDPERVAAVEAAAEAAASSGRPSATVVLMGGTPVVALRYAPSEGRPTRERPGRMLPAGEAPSGVEEGAEAPAAARTVGEGRAHAAAAVAGEGEGATARAKADAGPARDHSRTRQQGDSASTLGGSPKKRGEGREASAGPLPLPVAWTVGGEEGGEEEAGVPQWPAAEKPWVKR